MAMPRKDPYTFYMITDSLMPIMPDTYERYENKPKIAGVELTPETTIEDLDIYTREEIEALIRQSGAILVVPEMYGNRLRLTQALLVLILFIM